MKKLGFGCMRLPMGEDGEVDLAQFSRMVDAFLQNGFNYFDTAHSYVGGKSESAIGACLSTRYPRDRYILANKLTSQCFNKEDEIRPLFERQLAACGVEYFDYYLMHAQNAEFYKKYVACHAYEIAQQLKAEGKVRHIGISFHDKASVLDMILTEHPEIEVVQIQFNYVDYEDASIEGRLCYEVCRKHNKPVIVMEPVKGGILHNLPDHAKDVFDALRGGSYASYAVRFAASFAGVMLVLSGMSDMAQLEDNISYMKQFAPLSEAEFAAIDRVREVFAQQTYVPCTTCRYCTDECPKHIPIPALFSCLNAKKQYRDRNSDWYYMIHTLNKGKASDCIRCGACERSCPQHIQISALLQEVALEFEKNRKANF